MSDRGMRNALAIFVVLMVVCWSVIGCVWLVQAGFWWVALGVVFPVSVSFLYWIAFTDKIT